MPVPLTDAHHSRLYALAAEGFELKPFPLFPGYVGAIKYNCAALLEPTADGRLRVAAAPGYLLEGNIAVIVERGGEKWFVWKSHEVRATPARLAALERFEDELRALAEAPLV